MARRSLSLLLAALLSVGACWTPAWAGETSLRQANDPAEAPAGTADANAAEAAAAEAAADPVAAARTAWEAQPLELRRGLDLLHALERAGEAREATSLFKKFAREQKNAPVATYLRGRALGGEKGLADMRAALDAGLGQAAGTKADLRAWIELAPLEVAAGNAQEAARAAQFISDLRGGAKDWAYLAWIQERLLEQPKLAMDSYARALKLDEANVGARNALAVLKANAGEKREAMRLARAGVQQHADDASAHLHMGLVYALCGNNAAAKRSYADALSRAGRDVDDLTSIASAYMDIEDYNLAEAALRRADQVSADNPRVLTSQGLLAMERGDDKAARALLKKAAKVSPKDARIAFLQGVSEERLGLGSRAISSYRRATQLDPDRLDYVAALALALRTQGKYSPAVNKYKDAIKRAPEDASLRMQLGITYMKQRKYRKARASFVAAAERDDKSARPWFYIAIIDGDHLSKPKDALSDLERYAQLGGKEPTALKWLRELRAIYTK